MKETAVNYEKQLKKNLIMYPLGTVGRDMVYSLFANYLLTFVLITKGLTTAQLAAITGIETRFFTSAAKYFLHPGW